MKKLSIYFIVCLLGLLLISGTVAASYNAPKSDWLVSPDGFFNMGKWMFTVDKGSNSPRPANWIGQKIYGPNKNWYLYEPINVIIVDTHAKDAKDAADRLKKACEKADFPARIGHSGGYLGYMSKDYYEQVDRWFGLNDCCFADALFTASNINHGRAMGPYQVGKTFYFVIAFSGEKFQDGTHRYASFIDARNKFVANMDKKSGTFKWQKQEKVDMQNQISEAMASVQGLDHYTGDHDGFAYVLRAVK